MSRYAIVDEGTVVMHQAVVNADASIGRGCIFNTLSHIEHDVEIEVFCHISMGTMINGGAMLGKGTITGSYSVVNKMINIGEGTCRLAINN